MNQENADDDDDDVGIDLCKGWHTEGNELVLYKPQDTLKNPEKLQNKNSSDLFFYLSFQ